VPPLNIYGRPVVGKIGDLLQMEGCLTVNRIVVHPCQRRRSAAEKISSKKSGYCQTALLMWPMRF